MLIWRLWNRIPLWSRDVVEMMDLGLNLLERWRDLKMVNCENINCGGGL